MLLLLSVTLMCECEPQNYGAHQSELGKVMTWDSIMWKGGRAQRQIELCEFSRLTVVTRSHFASNLSLQVRKA